MINAINLFYKSASCPAIGDWAIANKLTHKFSEAKRGDIVLFDFNHNGTSDHIGIIYSVGNGCIYTVEGNTGNGSNTNGDGVYKRVRYKKDVNYIVRPKYTADITAEMLVKTALSQVGYKEGRNNDNKYGKWMGVNNQPWCACFVCWCFSHLEGEPVKINKPTGKYPGVISNDDIKLGSKGTAVKLWQVFLNWYYAFKLEADGDFGGLTEAATMQMQDAEGLEPDGIVGKLTRAAAKKYMVVAENATTSKYADMIVDSCKNLAWAYKTAKDTYYNKSKQAYKDALNKAYPDRSKWGTDARNGKSCDVFVGTVMRATGIDPNYPRGFDEQWKYVAKSDKYEKIPASKAQPGCIGQYIRTDGGVHTFIVTGKYVAEASHGDFYPALRNVKDSRLSTSGKKELRVYKIKENGNAVKLPALGADISYIQGKLTDDMIASAVKNLDFMILRLGIRIKPNFKNVVDDVFEYNYQKLHSKIPLGVYFYSRAINKAEAEQEAVFCIEKVKGKKLKLPVYLDVEDNIRQAKLSKKSLTAVINAWCTAMKSAGVPFGLYASMSWLNNKIDVSQLPKECSIWVAQYPSKKTDKSAYTGKHDLWQYTSSGKVAGFKGNLDLNYLYKGDFL